MRALAIMILFVGACGSSANYPGDGGNNGGNGGNGGSAGSGGGNGGNGGNDLSVGGPDLSAAYGCNEILKCIAMCGSSTSCQAQCRAGATSTGRGLYTSLRNCLRTACYVHPDAGNEPCTTTGAPSAACTQCLGDAVMPKASCSADPACGTCEMQQSACVAN